MGIRVHRFPEYHLNLHLLSGVITAEDLLRHFREDLDASARWFCYFDSTADLSGIDVAHIPELRRLVTRVEQRRVGEPVPTIMVNDSKVSDLFLGFWRSYNTECPHEVVMVDNLRVACDRLELPPEAYDKLAAAISLTEAGALARGSGREPPGSGATA